MKRTSLSLFLEQAPVNGFDEEGDQQYRVVLVDRAHGTVHPATKPFRSAAQALDAFTEGVKRAELVSFHLGELRQRVDGLGEDVTKVRGAVDHLRARIDALYGWARETTSRVRVVASAVTTNARRLKGGGVEVEFDDRFDMPEDPHPDPGHMWRFEITGATVRRLPDDGERPGCDAAPVDLGLLGHDQVIDLLGHDQVKSR